MGDDPNEKTHYPKTFKSTKSANLGKIFETCDNLKKWREEQMKQFQSMQLLTNEKLNLLNNGNQTHLECALEQAASNPDAGDFWRKDLNCSNISYANENDTTNSSNTLQESSITGHLQRCFNDSSQSNLSLSGNKVAYDIMNHPILAGIQSGKILSAGKDKTAKSAENSTESKPRRPFLKKGTGLLRYMPKSSTTTVKSKPLAAYNSPKKSNLLSQRTLNLKPAIRTSSVPTGRLKHIRFDIPGDVPQENEETHELPDSSDTLNADPNDSNQINLKGDSTTENVISEDRLRVNTNSVTESLKLAKENKELEEFEILENLAQNTSFNSDSSILQRVLHGENIKVHKNERKFPNSSYEHVNGILSNKEHLPKSTGNTIFSGKIDLSKCREELFARKQVIQKVISDINPRIHSLQKEISSGNQDNLNDSDVSERCSTPIEDLSVHLQELEIIPENNSLDDLACDIEKEECNPRLKTYNDVFQDEYPYKGSMKEIDVSCEISDTSPESNQVMNDKQKIREKLEELQKEISIYQEHNKKLSAICKERDEVLRKIQKEYNDFNKYKEAEKKKLEAEIQEERKQIKRQKETFARYQKLRKDNPSRKEREEHNALRQENEKLHEDLKRQKIKCTSDCRRMKNQLEASERERDSFKLKNIRLEEQVQDLLSALKARLKNNPEMLTTEINNKTNEDKSNLDAASGDELPEVQSKTKVMPDKPKTVDKTVLKENICRKEPIKVHFDLIDGNNEPGNTDSDSCSGSINGEQLKDTDTGAKQSFPNRLLENNTISEPSATSEEDAKTNGGIQKNTDNIPSNLSNISFTIEDEFREINHGNKIERIHVSGEREIIFNTGTRKIIGIDGKIKTIFYNGDTKEIFPDKREVYKYVNGRVETRFPDGLEITEFPNGQTQRCYPDGQKEVKFSDGAMHKFYADGSEEIKYTDGKVVNSSPDGTETIIFANGQKEIRTATYIRREFPDGSVKIRYDCGKQETRYSNGRIKIKDKDGKIIVDTKHLGITDS